MAGPSSSVSGGGTAAAAKNNRRDDELTDLLTKLYTIQEDIGAKPKTSEEEKKAKAANVQAMGQGKKAEKKGGRFLELKSGIVDRLKTIHQLLKSTKEKEAAGYGGDNAKDIIKMQAEIREHIRQAGEEWNEMDAIYKKEARKKKSKFTNEELEVQSELVRRLHAEIEKVKEAQMRGYAKNSRDSGGAAAASALGTKSLYVDSGACERRINAWSGWSYLLFSNSQLRYLSLTPSLPVDTNSHEQVGCQALVGGRRRWRRRGRHDGRPAITGPAAGGARYRL
jgi:hypothetical protein